MRLGGAGWAHQNRPSFDCSLFSVTACTALPSASAWCLHDFEVRFANAGSTAKHRCREYSQEGQTRVVLRLPLFLSFFFSYFFTSIWFTIVEVVFVETEERKGKDRQKKVHL